MYKVVRKKGDKLYSATIVEHFWSPIWNQSKTWRIMYIPNEWVRSKVGGLFVFNNLSDAIFFPLEILNTHCLNEIEIWECRTKEAKPIGGIVVSPNDFLPFWTKSSTTLLIVTPPRGTLTASEVMLTKRVRTWNEIIQQETENLRRGAR